jgi:hypothetical protein
MTGFSLIIYFQLFEASGIRIRLANDGMSRKEALSSPTNGASSQASARKREQRQDLRCLGLHCKDWGVAYSLLIGPQALAPGAFCAGGRFLTKTEGGDTRRRLPENSW